jgi:hypothetical protein
MHSESIANAEVAEAHEPFWAGGFVDAVAACFLSPADAEENTRRALTKERADLMANGQVVPPWLQDRLDLMNNARALANPAYRPATPVAKSAQMPSRERKQTVTGTFATAAQKAPAMTDADARKLLLSEIGHRRGGAAAHRCRHMTVDQLAATLGSTKATRSQISASWDRAFKRVGAQID